MNYDRFQKSPLIFIMIPFACALAVYSIAGWMYFLQFGPKWTIFSHLIPNWLYVAAVILLGLLFHFCSVVRMLTSFSDPISSNLWKASLAKLRLTLLVEGIGLLCVGLLFGWLCTVGVDQSTWSKADKKLMALPAIFLGLFPLAQGSKYFLRAFRSNRCLISLLEKWKRS